MKNKHVFLFLAAGFFALASVGCGKRHSAKKLVENFIDEHAQQPSVSITDVGKLDSTDRVDYHKCVASRRKEWWLVQARY